MSTLVNRRVIPHDPELEGMIRKVIKGPKDKGPRDEVFGSQDPRYRPSNHLIVGAGGVVTTCHRLTAVAGNALADQEQFKATV